MKIKFKHRWRSQIVKIILILSAFFLFSAGILAIWLALIPIPDFDASLQEKRLSNSTKIYDRTGKILFYDVNGNIRRTIVPLNDISPLMKKAVLDTEDDSFYQHRGISPKAILRSIFIDLSSGSIRQGGSTITQQVVKNLLLTKDKTIIRKLKEIILALKIEKIMTKDQIFELYLNIAPFGGNIYGVEEASISFFGKKAKDLTLLESAYLAALPKAPSYFSPYGSNRDKLEERKNFVIDRMFANGDINLKQATEAKKEKITFSILENNSLKAPHFVFYILKDLEKKYGKENIENKGYRVITTLDYSLQIKAEKVLAKYGEINEKNFNAKNNSLVVIDPKTGQILVMVGSRDFFDLENDGNYNVTTALRQPGSAFKPIVYATAFNQGYTPETVVFDLPTQFNVNCSPEVILGAKNTNPNCYAPENYDNKFLGPISLRNALAQSRNVPAIKVLYLAGINNSLEMAKKLGLSTLKNKNQYGLTLVLGGGEVSLLELSGAYGVFANDGIKNSIVGVLRVEDNKGNVLEEYKPDSTQVIPANTARLISDVLSDNQAKIPAYGANSPLFFPGRQIASKTGTTDDYRDTWVIGYTPSLVVGAWVGNNDNSPMEKKVAGMIVVPMWNTFMREILETLPNENFIKPEPISNDLKPILRGIWQTENSNTHSILYWVNKNNPNGPIPYNPYQDGQFSFWETAVQKWLINQGYNSSNQTPININSELINNSISKGFSIISPNQEENYSINNPLIIKLKIDSLNSITKVDYFVNNIFIGTNKNSPFDFIIKADDLKIDLNELKVIIFYSNGEQKESSVKFKII
ncbi:MAG: hypothetical protein COX02_02285 [Candidatus Vogelbacteria bacterium CG22_combo_CG10-13_8_21_14_all_37_9]|uniref:Uncharacterized protein n=1 Tax=Candidatus Vogelbacteria bacterium CG22_combo_CG10-13_8_21_14_all_37_9 TaxID=1975046 RepID=A0A2H0BK60_9BACT|nr:MAG: hypothetical protein BK005_01245 [bacterium CG10_37_50]PIP58063.1 MAG: hypothetical protein COX02_02285 [Candidatus Vogelbacteria bacterium CG22_combo_CG10-13_8_21_14_all_37_9]